MKSNINKVICVGMSKTGTSTLDICLEYLGFGPAQGFDNALTSEVENGNIERAMAQVESAGYLEDSPWFLLYKEIDKAYPNCKFILTTRKSSEAHAISNWHHTLRKGQRVESEKDESLRRTKLRYEKHNKAVRDYFRDRPEDLLEVCWENQDGWAQICPFLGVDIPNIAFPHVNSKPTHPMAPIQKLLKRKTIYVKLMRAANFINSIKR